MLTDTTLRNLKPQPKRYKVVDRDGMYVLVSPTGGHFVSLRLPSERSPRDIHHWSVLPAPSKDALR